MSSKLRSHISKELLDKEFVSANEKAQALSSALWGVTKSATFYGAVLQCMNITYTHQVPTAGVMFNSDMKRWELLINPFFFCKKLTPAQRVGVLIHEIYHITHKHPFRIPFMKLSARKRALMNIAADMAINQHIEKLFELPYGCPQCPPPGSEDPCPNELCPGKCIRVEDFYDVDPTTNKRTPWAFNQTMEAYYELLIRRFDDPNKDQGGSGKGGQSGDGSDDSLEGNAGGGAQTSDLPDTIDEHMWDGASSEKDMLDGISDLIKRAMNKMNSSYDKIPDSVKELLDYVDTRRAELNYKALIMSAMKKHASGHDRTHTWTRKSKRFGFKAPGTKVGELPRLELYLDTSGSISTEELNEFLSIVDDFLKVGSRKCNISFFHTSLYGRQNYKLGTTIDRSQIQMGGTELEPVLKDIFNRKGDLSIIITDGYYDNVNFESWMRPEERFPQVLWIISKEGQENHPLARLGETVKVPNN